MNANDFRRLALALPEAVEQQHMNHPDFRVGGKIFATLSPDEDWGGLNLTPDQQASHIESQPDSFKPANGAWGRKGFTIVTLAGADASTVEIALLQAWRNRAPTRLIDESEE